MGRTRLVLLGGLIMAVAAVAGCDDSTDTAGGPVGGSSLSPTTASATSAAPTVDAATKAACIKLGKDVKTAMAKVADAEKIGPPAGHSAVSAQYSAGSASLYAHMIGVSAQVSDPAEKVATAMSDLADKWATNPAAKPSKATLNAAVKQLTAACAAG